MPCRRSISSRMRNQSIAGSAAGRVVSPDKRLPQAILGCAAALRWIKSAPERWLRRCLDSGNAVRRCRWGGKGRFPEGGLGIFGLREKCQSFSGGRLIFVFRRTVSWAGCPAAHRVVGVGVVSEVNSPGALCEWNAGSGVHRGISRGVETGAARAGCGVVGGSVVGIPVGVADRATDCSRTSWRRGWYPGRPRKSRSSWQLWNFGVQTRAGGERLRLRAS